MLLETETMSDSPDASTSQVSCFKRRFIKCTQDVIFKNMKESQLYEKSVFGKFRKCAVSKSIKYEQSYNSTLNSSRKDDFDNIIKKSSGYTGQEIGFNENRTISQFYPLADENSSYNRFQLSKSSANLPRLFGKNRTNFMQDLPKPKRSQNKIQFHIGNVNSNQISSTFKEIPAMFRSYDLNDDYWLNFE